MKESGYYPSGAEFDNSAPYNQPLDIEHEVFVSVSLSYSTTVLGPKEMNEELIIEEAKEEAKKKFKDYIIDDISVIND